MYIVLALFFVFGGVGTTVSKCCGLLHCTHPILLKTAIEGAVLVIPGPAKMRVFTLEASIRQKSPTFFSGFIKTVQMSQKTRTGCASSNASFPFSSQNCFYLKVSFCGGEVILYFLMKSRWVALKKKKKEERKEKAEDSQRKDWMNKTPWKP